MELIINGNTKEVPQLEHLSDLVQHLELPAFGTAIECNGQVVRKAEYATTRLNPGDKLEIVRLVGGG